MIVMRILFYSTKPYDRRFFEAANASATHGLHFIDAKLDGETAALAAGFDAVCVFVNDGLSELVLQRLAEAGVRFILLRCAGYNHLDREAAARLGLRVGYVPHYSPHSVAEHAVALLLALNRKLHRAYGRVREGNFSIEGFLGFDLHGRTVGLVGLGRIGGVFARIMSGFGCRVLAYDPAAKGGGDLPVEMRGSLREVVESSDIISLHCPLTPETRHIINREMLAAARRGVVLINTSRGGLIDSRAAVDALKSGHLGALGIDVYEDEAAVFYEDLSGQIMTDDVLARLISFPNVLITSHQGFFTREAMTTIAETTLRNASDLAAGRRSDSILPPA